MRFILGLSSLIVIFASGVWLKIAFNMLDQAQRALKEYGSNEPLPIRRPVAALILFVCVLFFGAWGTLIWSLVQ